MGLCLGSGRADAPAAGALRISSLHKLLASLSLSFLVNKMGVVMAPASQAREVSAMSQTRLGVTEASAQVKVAISPPPPSLRFPPHVSLVSPSCVASGRLLNISEPTFLFCKTRMLTPTSEACDEGSPVSFLSSAHTVPGTQRPQRRRFFCFVLFLPPLPSRHDPKPPPRSKHHLKAPAAARLSPA